MEPFFGPVECLNWDHRFPMSASSSSHPSLTRIYSRIGRAAVACAALGFNGTQAYCGLPPKASRIHNLMATVLLILAVASIGGYVPTWIALSFVVATGPEVRSAAGLLYAVAKAALSVAALIALAMVAIGLRDGGWASVRRALIVVWPIVLAAHHRSIYRRIHVYSAIQRRLDHGRR
jgi:hypothetical protein